MGLLKILGELELHEQLFLAEQVYMEVGSITENFFQLAQSLI